MRREGECIEELRKAGGGRAHFPGPVKLPPENGLRARIAANTMTVLRTFPVLLVAWGTANEIVIMSERRFDEAEVAEIFRAAAELENASPKALARVDGMTLAELQQIGEEAGLRPDLVARAAAAQVTAGSASTSRLLGLPIGVSHTVDLDHAVNDQEWALLVSNLRETFDAKGVLRQDGAFRQWSNGNLHVLVEPTPSGSRVRFRTRNALSQTLITGGSLAVFGALAMVVMDSAGADAARQSVALLAAGGGMGLWGALRLPPWAQRRRRQMEELSRKLAMKLLG